MSKKKNVCPACNGYGFLLMDNDVHGVRIERCDTCEKFANDEDANVYAYKKAMVKLMRNPETLKCLLF